MDKNILASRLFELFRGRTNDYAIQQSNGSYLRAGKSLTEDIICSHISGEETVAVYILDEECRVRFFCIDVDGNPDDLGETQAAASLIAGELKALGIDYINEFSGMKGYHLWVLLDSPIQAADAIRFMRSLLLSSGWEQRSGKYYYDDYPSVHCEILPKHPKPGGQGLGSDIKLPLGEHQKSRKHSYFCDDDFERIIKPEELLSGFPIPGTTEKVKRYSDSVTSVYISENYKKPQRINNISEIKAALGIEDMFEHLSGEELPRDNGNPYTRRCPFPDHEDMNPSMTINPGTDRFDCGGCGRSGDIFDAYAVWYGIEGHFPRVLKEVAEIVGVEIAIQEKEPDAPVSYTPISIGELLSGDYPRPKFIIKGLLRVGGTALLYGQEKIGKTMLATQLATELASGNKFLGVLETEESRVAYVTTDMPVDAFIERLERMVLIKDMKDLENKVFFYGDLFKMDKESHVDGLLESLLKENIDVLIIDTY